VPYARCSGIETALARDAPLTVGRYKVVEGLVLNLLLDLQKEEPI